MFSFKQFISENVKFNQGHIPSEEWLKGKQDDAEHYAKKAKSENHVGVHEKGYAGSTTGHFKEIKLPVDHIKHLPGVHNEQKHRDDTSTSKSTDLEKDVGHPSKFDSKKHPIHILVNHKGEAHVSEGNHRLAYAKRHGITHIHANVDYFNGGERVNGHMHPDKLKALHKEE